VLPLVEDDSPGVPAESCSFPLHVVRLALGRELAADRWWRLVTPLLPDRRSVLQVSTGTRRQVATCSSTTVVQDQGASEPAPSR
jgi:hypothetical protein